MVSNVIKKPVLFQSIVWDGNNFDEIDNMFPHYDFEILENKRLKIINVALKEQSTYKNLCNDANKDDICIFCIASLSDIIVKNMETGESNIWKKERYSQNFVELKPDEAKATTTPTNDINHQ